MPYLPKQRTILQNKALHLYFKFLAEELNDAGLDMRKVLKPEVEIPWNTITIKEHLWKPVQKAQLEKGSTTELTTEEIDQVFDTLNRHIAKKGIHVPFPSIKSLMDKIASLPRKK